MARTFHFGEQSGETKKQCIYLRTETEQMKIKKNLVYTIKEASSLTGISTRTLSRTAKKYNLERIDNRYVFTGDFILETFKKQLKKVASPKNNGEDNGEQVGEQAEIYKVQIQELTKENNVLKNQIKELKSIEPEKTTEALKQLIEKFTISEIQELDLKMKDKGELSNIGNLWFVKKGVMLQEYTPTEYDIAFKRLTEWRLQQKEIEKQAAEIDEIKVSSTERVEHYKNLFEYQRKQSDRILRIHEKLVTSINELTNANIQRNVIEAKEKGVINDDWKTTED